VDRGDHIWKGLQKVCWAVNCCSWRLQPNCCWWVCYWCKLLKILISVLHFLRFKDFRWLKAGISGGSCKVIANAVKLGVQDLLLSCNFILEYVLVVKDVNWWLLICWVNGQLLLLFAGRKTWACELDFLEFFYAILGKAENDGTYFVVEYAAGDFVYLREKTDAWYLGSDLLKVWCLKLNSKRLYFKEGFLYKEKNLFLVSKAKSQPFWAGFFMGKLSELVTPLIGVCFVLISIK